MQKIMFNDRYELTKAVLEGQKKMTRRIFRLPNKLASEYLDVTDKFVADNDTIKWCDCNGNVRLTSHPLYKVGEIVAIAQRYDDIDSFYYAAYQYKHSVHGQTICEYDAVSDKKIKEWINLSAKLSKEKTWKNKMFVRADLMLHHIRITGINAERLQDISDEDCLKEGIVKQRVISDDTPFLYAYDVYKNDSGGYFATRWFKTPREAFADLIDKISGKGTWESNPYMFAYEFELID